MSNEEAMLKYLKKLRDELNTANTHFEMAKPYANFVIREAINTTAR
ncbi:MAG: hypothetical protein JXA46_16880 [Dehalococcoidales bacterium]|nr:hypothetical protein [Dehalococcoidales bacterium]